MTEDFDSQYWKRCTTSDLFDTNLIKWNTNTNYFFRRYFRKNLADLIILKLINFTSILMPDYIYIYKSSYKKRFFYILIAILTFLYLHFHVSTLLCRVLSDYQVLGRQPLLVKNKTCILIIDNNLLYIYIVPSWIHIR